MSTLTGYAQRTFDQVAVPRAETRSHSQAGTWLRSRLATICRGIVGACALFVSATELSRDIESSSPQRRQDLLASWVDAAVR